MSLRVYQNLEISVTNKIKKRIPSILSDLQSNYKQTNDSTLKQLIGFCIGCEMQYISGKDLVMLHDINLFDLLKDYSKPEKNCMYNSYQQSSERIKQLNEKRIEVNKRLKGRENINLVPTNVDYALKLCFDLGLLPHNAKTLALLHQSNITSDVYFRNFLCGELIEYDHLPEHLPLSLRLKAGEELNKISNMSTFTREHLFEDWEADKTKIAHKRLEGKEPLNVSGIVGFNTLNYGCRPEFIPEHTQLDVDILNRFATLATSNTKAVENTRVYFKEIHGLPRSYSRIPSLSGIFNY